MDLFKRVFNDNPKKAKDLSKPTITNNLNQNKQKKPDKLFFNNLVDFEQRMNKEPTVQLVCEVLSMYRQCVEYFDSQQEPIKYYFIDKIQVALAESRTFQVILQQKKLEQQTSEDSEYRSTRQQSLFTKPSTPWILDQDKPTMNPTIIINEVKVERNLSRSGSEDEIDLLSKQSSKQSPLGKLAIPSNTILSTPVPMNRIARAKMLNMQVQFQEQNEENSDQKDNLLNEYDEKTKDADDLVRHALQDQAESVKNRLAKRFTQLSSDSKKIQMSRSQQNLEDDQSCKLTTERNLIECISCSNLDTVINIQEITTSHLNLSNVPTLE